MFSIAEIEAPCALLRRVMSVSMVLAFLCRDGIATNEADTF